MKVWPTVEQVKEIYKATYIFFDKYKDVEINWDELADEVTLLSNQYPFDLCTQILVHHVGLLENIYSDKEG
ncbi:MAG: hypothetical protein CVU95_00835 [Firmicutes bacterium HGW-Firmicutes-2]|jgi:hypothetical protein|nr:MAG: hypothetical protein CVU95_00835 [Firmicutes bacterium HGW-Firmicutes-2]